MRVEMFVFGVAVFGFVSLSVDALSANGRVTRTQTVTDYADSDQDPCFNKPCQHKGLCTKPSPDAVTYACDCANTGYEGAHCETGIISLPENVRVRAGVLSDDVILTAFPEQELNLTAETGNGVQVFPDQLFIRNPSTSAVFKILAPLQGKFSIRFRPSGADAGSFSDVTTLDVLSDDVFSKYQIQRQGLPEGNFSIDLSPYGFDYKFTSTSQWYRLISDQNVFFTMGVTFSSVGNVSLPMSVTGLKVNINDKLVVLPVIEDLNPNNGTVDPWVIGRSRQEPFELSVKDINDFINKSSILRTVFASLELVLPPWLRFSVTSNSSEPFFSAQISSGSIVKELPYCAGAPVFEDSVYHVFQFTRAIVISLVNQDLYLPDTNSERYCMILDLNKDYGTTFMMMFPRKSAALLEQVEVFKKLKQDTGVRLFPNGLGLSLLRKLNVRQIGTELDLWNGNGRFKYPLSQTATFWLSLDADKVGDSSKSFDFSIAPVPIEIYVALPDIRKVLTHLFVEPWEVYLRAGGKPLEVTFYVKILNKPSTIRVSSDKFFQQTIQAFGSVGGLEARKYCGPQANPPGIFTTVSLDANLLIGVPVLHDLHFDIKLKADFFYRLDNADVTNVPKPIDIIKAVLTQVKQVALELLNFVKAEIQKYISVIAPVILQAIQQFRQLIEGLLQIVNQFLNGFDVNALITNVADLVRDIVASINSLVQRVRELEDFDRIMFEESLKSFITFVETKVQEIKTNALTMVQTLYDETVGIFKGPKTFGIRGNFSITVLDKTFGIDGEFLSSDRHLGGCGDLVEINNHMQGEAAWRAFGVVHNSENKVVNKLWSLLSVRPGVPFEVALANDSNNFVIQLHARLNFFGAKATADLFVTNKDITASAEVNIWGIFTARLTIRATVFVNSADWALQITGEFIPGGGRKRQAENSVQASLGDAIRRFVNRLADEAVKRINKAQEAVNSAKGKLTNAQRWLDEKKAGVDKANVVFDKAIADLERAKESVEAAKGPFNQAQGKLTAAQKRVNGLCRIKTCSKICIPGLKFEQCWVLFAYLPCPKWVSCLTEITDPICVAANLACKGIRAIAFGALEVAKLAVRAPALALDVAKGGLYVAQIAVDKSRVVLDVAKSAFDLAKGSLNVAKGALSVANKALEGVKYAVRAGQFVMNFIVKHGLQSIIDIGKCGFETELSRDLFEFEIFCDVNPFRLGWRTVRFRLNFRDISGSIWNAAKSLVNRFLDSVKKMLGRRKREIDYDVFARLHKTLLYGRQEENGTFGEFIFGNIEDRVTNNTVLTNTTSRSETEFWKEQCGRYSPIVNFLRLSIEELRNVTYKIDASMQEVATRGSETVEIRNSILSTTADDSEIDYTIAEEDFNVTREEIVNVVREVNNNLQEDDVMKESKDATEYIIGQNDKAMRSFAAVEILPLWRERMENVTEELMLTDECSGFYDCVVWSFGDLYQLIDSVDPLLLPGAQENLPPLEELFYSLFDNDTQSFMVLKDVTTEILDSLRLLNTDDVFCGTVPEITKGPANVTVRSADSVTLTCAATSVPDPKFFWLKNEELYATGASLTLTAVGSEDAGEYVCVAGNHVANVSTDPATVTVISPPVLLSRLPTRLDVAVGDNVSVVCNVSATPKAHIRWVMESDDTFSIENATLRLSDTQLFDAGVYQCNAENTHGRISSNEMTLVVQEASPLCPKLTVEFGFISDTADAVRQIDTLLQRNVDRLSLDTVFEEVVILLANSTTLPLSVGVVIPTSPPNVASLSMTAGCGLVPQKCSYAGCVQIYKDAHILLQTAIARIQEAILADQPLFIRDGKVYYFNPSMVNVPEESNSCPSGFKEMETKLCAKLSGV